MNVVATGRGRFVEVQGTAEQGSFSAEQLGAMTALAQRAIAEITKQQLDAVARARPGA
jgi:ribonuclease PH